MTFLARLPTSIARAVTVQRAKVAARKTVTVFLCPAASVALANCVRSPPLGNENNYERTPNSSQKIRFLVFRMEVFLLVVLSAPHQKRE